MPAKRIVPAENPNASPVHRIVPSVEAGVTTPLNWVLAPGVSGSFYSFVAAEVAAEGGGEITLAGGAMDGNFVQYGGGFGLTSISEPVWGPAEFFQFGGASAYGWGLKTAANPGLTSTLLKVHNVTLDATKEFDLIGRCSTGVGGLWGPNTTGYSQGVMLWDQGPGVGDDIAWLMGWGSNGYTSNSMNGEPYAASGVDATAAIIYQRGSTSNEATTEFWSRIARGGDGVVRAFYKEAVADPWIEVVTAPVHAVFSSTSVNAGFGLTQWDATHGGTRIFNADFTYFAP